MACRVLKGVLVGLLVEGSKLASWPALVSQEPE
jgi:hypothetical protein